jgi:hypothetical protein
MPARTSLGILVGTPLLLIFVFVFVFVFGGGLGAARAHVAPSAEQNNRYLKATLLPTEVRLTYTLFLGELPGRLERRRIDTSRDGSIDDAEAKAFGARLLGELAGGLDVTIDGRKATGWIVADVGLGTATTAGGALALDLALVVPYPDPAAAAHVLFVDDHTSVPLAGESEVRVEESPGVRLVECHRADAAGGIELGFPFTGNARGPGEREITARFTVDASARPAPPGAVSARLWLALGLVGVAAVALGLVVAHRRRAVP